jgi:hypothetical protein
MLGDHVTVAEREGDPPGLRFDEYLRRAHAGEHGRRFLESFDVYEAEVS